MGVVSGVVMFYWMRTPARYAVDADGRFVAASWLEVIFNPSFPYRLVQWCWRPTSPRRWWSARSAHSMDRAKIKPAFRGYLVTGEKCKHSSEIFALLAIAPSLRFDGIRDLAER